MAEVDVCRKKYEQASAKAGTKAEAQSKVEASKDTLETAVTAMKAAQGSYLVGLGDMKRDYKRLGKPIIDLVQEQIAYHRVRVFLFALTPPFPFSLHIMFDCPSASRTTHIALHNAFGIHV